MTNYRPTIISIFFLSTLLLQVAACSKPAEQPKFGSDDYDKKVKEIVNTLTQNEPAQFKAFLSPDLIERTEKEYGDGAIDKIIHERYVPFFSDLARLDTNSNSMPTTDGSGHKGVAIFKTFITDEGEQKPFGLYIIEKDGQLKVGNLLLNKTLQEAISMGGTDAKPEAPSDHN